MRRRQFIVGLGAVLAWPVVAQQTTKVPRIGFLWDSPDLWPAALESFRRGLRDLGWIEGRNVVVDYRWAEGRFDRLQEIADELVKLNVDIIVAPSSIYTEAARRATSTIPIIFASHADPIGSNHVASVRRPGGNITGLSLLMSETNAKGLELLKEAIPDLSQVAVLFDPATPSHAPGLQMLEDTAAALAIRIRPLAVRGEGELHSTFAVIASDRAQAVLVLNSLFMGAPTRIAELALEHRLPAMFGAREHTEAGGLLSYSPDRADLWRRAATYVDEVLKGGDPADMPVQQPTKFELTINLKTAKALNLVIPPTLLARADEVIE
jgi:putative tryptophan/tyrosine transport system substrate-binding protein